MTEVYTTVWQRVIQMRAEIWWRGDGYDDPWGCRPFGADSTFFGATPQDAVRRASAWWQQCVKDSEEAPV